MRGAFWIFFSGFTLGIVTMRPGRALDAKVGDAVAL
jgi:hypothetical protein